MNIFTYIIIYLLICALIITFVPVARSQWKDFIINPTSYSYKDKRLAIKIFISLLLIVMIIMFFILTPLLLPMLIKYDRKNRKREKTDIKDDNLYFWRMGGVGQIQCLNCSYQEEILSFIHGLNTSSTGLQCQSCGQFHSIKDWQDNKHLYCGCGGILEREMPVFCPECKSKKIQYNMSFIA